MTARTSTPTLRTLALTTLGAAAVLMSSPAGAHAGLGAGSTLEMLPTTLRVGDGAPPR